MKTICLTTCLIIFSFSACKNATTDNHDTYAGEYPFEQRELVFSANPSKALEDTTISLKVTCYPKFTGTGWMSISLGAPASWVALEFPYKDTLKDYTEVRVHTKFQAGNHFTQEWRFKLLRTFSSNYAIAALAAYDSIFIADSAKMYAIDSPELKKIKWIEPGGPLQYFMLPKP